MSYAAPPNTKGRKRNGRRGRRLGVALMSFMLFAFGMQTALAYNYAGYRWGGSWPTVTVDYSGIAVTAWRERLQNTMNDWNATGAKFTFRSGSSNNDVTTYYAANSTLAYVDVGRKYRWWGDIVRVTEKINVYHRFSPPQGDAHDFSTVVRHEYGHWLRLNHTVAPSLMQDSLAKSEIHYVDADARNGIRSIYGVR